MGCLVCAFACSRPGDPAVYDRLLIGSGDCHEEGFIPYGPLDLRLTRLVPASGGAVGGDIGADFAALGWVRSALLAGPLASQLCMSSCLLLALVYLWMRFCIL